MSVFTVPVRMPTMSISLQKCVTSDAKIALWGDAIAWNYVFLTLMERAVLWFILFRGVKHLSSRL